MIQIRTNLDIFPNIQNSTTEVQFAQFINIIHLWNIVWNKKKLYKVILAQKLSSKFFWNFIHLWAVTIIDWLRFTASTHLQMISSNFYTLRTRQSISSPNFLKLKVILLLSSEKSRFRKTFIKCKFGDKVICTFHGRLSQIWIIFRSLFRFPGMKLILSF